MIKVITLTFGFAESQKLAVLGFIHPKGFKTNFEALQSLSEDLMNYFNTNYREPVRKCCKEFYGQKLNYSYCPTCGGRINHITDVETYQSWLVSLISKTNDDFGRFDFSLWAPWENWLDINKKYRLDIWHNAENALVCALPVTSAIEDLEHFWANYAGGDDDTFLDNKGMQAEQDHFIKRLNKNPDTAVPEGTLV